MEGSYATTIYLVRDSHRSEKGANLLTRLTPSLEATPLLAWLLVMRMLLEFAKKPALLELHVEALQGAVDGLIGLNGYVNQKTQCLRKATSMAQTTAMVKAADGSGTAVTYFAMFTSVFRLSVVANCSGCKNGSMEFKRFIRRLFDCRRERANAQDSIAKIEALGSSSWT